MAKIKAIVATQFKRFRAKKLKRKAQSTVEIVRPWVTPQFKELNKEERDIVLDRLQKEVTEVPTTRRYAVRGVNEVARAVVKGKIRVVVFANNPESFAFGHLPLLCRLHQVPICVLHLSSKAFGRVFNLKSMVAVGMKASMVMVTQDEAKKEKEQAVATKTPTPLTEAEQKKLASITGFLISKASKRTL